MVQPLQPGPKTKLARILGAKGFPRIQKNVLHAKTKIFCRDGAGFSNRLPQHSGATRLHECATMFRNNAVTSGVMYPIPPSLLRKCFGFLCRAHQPILLPSIQPDSRSSIYSAHSAKSARTHTNYRCKRRSGCDPVLIIYY